MKQITFTAILNRASSFPGVKYVFYGNDYTKKVLAKHTVKICKCRNNMVIVISENCDINLEDDLRRQKHWFLKISKENEMVQESYFYWIFGKCNIDLLRKEVPYVPYMCTKNYNSYIIKFPTPVKIKLFPMNSKFFYIMSNIKNSFVQSCENKSTTWAIKNSDEWNKMMDKIEAEFDPTNYSKNFEY